MKLSTKGRYAVMAMVDLACQQSSEPVALVDIGLRQNISISYLEQLFGKLRKSGLVRSVRGPGGGYILSRGISKINILNIIEAVDEPVKATRCHPNSTMGCQIDGTECLTHDLWSELGNQILLYLSSVSLEQVVEKKVVGTSGSHFFPSERVFERNISPKNHATMSSVE